MCLRSHCASLSLNWRCSRSLWSPIIETRTLSQGSATPYLTSGFIYTRFKAGITLQYIPTLHTKVLQIVEAELRCLSLPFQLGISLVIVVPHILLKFAARLVSIWYAPSLVLRGPYCFLPECKFSLVMYFSLRGFTRLLLALVPGHGFSLRRISRFQPPEFPQFH